MDDELVAGIKQHLGGDEVLAFLGAHNFIAEHDKVNFLIERPNPKGVHTVVIAAQPHGMYNMHCYGPRFYGSMKAPHIGTATQILPENLATVLGMLSGIEEIHHRHF
ncbi:MAG: hypothetical protein KDJ29_01030 [Hyphomicrobiales bacterium]|nr:hypothetical protein [Hyphomicrobiales bacterium]